MSTDGTSFLYMADPFIINLPLCLHCYTKSSCTDSFQKKGLGWGSAQLVECSPNVHEALASIANTT